MPSAAKRNASARPIPLPAPVTTATFPANSFIVLLVSQGSTHRTARTPWSRRSSAGAPTAATAGDRGRHPPGIRRGQVDAGRDDLVDPVEHVPVEPHLGGGELGLQVGGGAWPDDRAGDRGVGEHEADRQLDEREPRLVGELGELVDGRQLRLVGGEVQVVAIRYAFGAPALVGLARPEASPPANRRPAGSTAAPPCRTARSRAARPARCHAPGSSTAVARSRSVRGCGAGPPTAPPRSGARGRWSCRSSGSCRRAPGR